MFVHVVPMGMMKVPIVQIVHVATMLYGGMSAVGSMSVVVIRVSGAVCGISHFGLLWHGQ